MKTLSIVLLSFAVLASAQAPESKPDDRKALTTDKVDPKLHADVLQLVEMSGMRKQIQDGLVNSMPTARKAMMDHCPKCKPEFGDEWVKRMTARLNVDDYVAVYVEGYEKYLSEAEVVELTSLQRDVNAKRDAVPSTELKAKLTSVMSTLMGEVYGKCAQIGATLGAKIGEEIGQEHPDWLGLAAKPDKP